MTQGTAKAEFRIRRAQPGDARGIHEAHMRSIREICSNDYTAEQIQAWGGREFDEAARLKAIRDHHVWIVESGSEILGFAQLNPSRGSAVALLHGLYLVPEAKSRSIGHQLLTQIEDFAVRELAAQAIMLSATRTALNFYRTHGFSETAPERSLPINGVPIPSTPMTKTFLPPELSAAVTETLVYLGSNAATESIRRDPYWPKWDSPWWHMLLLHEMGLAPLIPKTAIRELVSVLQRHYLPLFPIQAHELPEGTDPVTKIACHCALGSIDQVLHGAGVEVDSELPWIRPWFLRYQLPDGGLNCDDEAYRKAAPKSSLVSTLPALEAVLFCTKRPFTDAELEFLDRGARYLIEHRLFRRKSDGSVIDPGWLEAKFPRYYGYDFLRGYSFLARWASVRGQVVPAGITEEAERLIEAQITPEGLRLQRLNRVDSRSYNPGADGNWSWGAAEWPRLHEIAGAEGSINAILTRQWNEARSLARGAKA